MFDIVTVVFESELETLKLQARSIELYAQQCNVRCIYVMVNDNSTIDTMVFGSMANLVRVIPRNIYGCDWGSNGWVSQQVLKMYGAALSSNTWSMILDAKTLFVKQIDPQEIIVNSQAQVGSLDIYPVFEKSKEIAENLFKIKLDQQLGPGGVPFIIHNATVRSMIAEVEHLTQMNFSEWFQQQGMITEFILYSAFLQYKYGSFAPLYSNINKVICANLCHSEVDSFDRKFAQMNDATTLTVSVHRNAWHNLTATQQNQYNTLLKKRNIL